MVVSGPVRRSDVTRALVVGALVIAHAAFEPGLRPPTGIDFALLAVASLSLVVVRTIPVAALLTASACEFVYLTRVEDDIVSISPVLICVYYATRARHRVVAPLASVPFIVLGFTNATSPSDAILPIGWFAAAMCFGELHEQYQARVEEARLRAAEAERIREETASRRADEERVRIARDLHDSLTHTMSVIKVQADVAVHLARKRGEEIPESVLAIQSAARDGNRELRSTLDVLRAPHDHNGAGLADLPALVESARHAGVEATVVIDGQERPVPTAVGGTIYRIVQEALTNVGRHSGTEGARVQLRFAPHEVAVTIDDDGTASSDKNAVPGVGLIGMRERVAAQGGTLETGPKPDGGFRVAARLPVEGTTS